MNTAIGVKSKNIVHDAWLSSILSQSVYRVDVDNELKTESQQRGGIETLIPKGRAFLYSKVAAEDLQSAFFLEDQGFHLVETNLVFSKRCSPGKPGKFPALIRLATSRDEDQAVALARRSFSWSRFHLDPVIGIDTANFLKSEWARNFFKGKRGEGMVLAEQDSQVIGFLQLLKRDKTLTIDLIAVDSDYRGKGIAAAMITFAENSFSECDQIQAGTQAANIISVNLYERLGFQLSKSAYVFHRHLEGARKS